MTTLEKIIEQIKSGQAENITEIDLSHNQIGYRGAIALSKALIEANLPYLKQIDLSFNKIGYYGAIEFAKALKEANLPHLKVIHLKYNIIGDKGAIAIAEALIEANLPHLERIYLADNEIGDEGAIAFAEALIEANLPCLKQIDLNCNEMGDEGAIAFAEALIEANLPYLKQIDLSCNEIGYYGAIEFAEALIEANLPYLKQIDLSYNEMGDEWNKVIAEISETYISSNEKYLAEATEKAMQKLQQDWDSIAEPIKQALIDIEYAKLLQEEGKLKAAIGLYGVALHGFRHLIGKVPKSLDVKQTIKQAAEDMLFAINKLNGEIEELKLPVFVLECFEHLNAKAFERDLLKLFADRGIKSLWDQNLAGIIFDMMPSKGQPAFFLDMFSKLAATDSKDESDACNLTGDVGTTSQADDSK